ncbi:MAG: hypothetical protein LBD60_01505 [Puniceicoccales bacterium]|jgi:hypothetical protein|nr:hypothetical protein [Puniceicoccales bacterium]
MDKLYKKVLPFGFNCFIITIGYAFMPNLSLGSMFYYATKMVPRKPQVYRRQIFTPKEDERLCILVAHYEEKNWELVASYMPNRNPRQCRERWFNYLDPARSSLSWTPKEDALLQEKIKVLGSRWTLVAKFLPGRTDMDCKNRWHLLCNCQSFGGRRRSPRKKQPMIRLPSSLPPPPPSSFSENGSNRETIDPGFIDFYKPKIQPPPSLLPPPPSSFLENGSDWETIDLGFTNSYNPNDPFWWP